MIVMRCQLSQKPLSISNNYHAPVQVFNGPVYFGSSSESFNTFSKKRPRQVESENKIPKRRLVQTKEETFFN